MTAKKLNASHYHGLLEYLRQFWPKSLMLYSLVKRLQRGVFKDFNVWVDKWPEPEAIVANADPNICEIYCWKIIILPFDKNPSAFVSLLLEVDIISLDGKLRRVIPGISSETYQLLQETIHNRSVLIDESEMMWIKPQDERIKKSCLPDEYHVGPMTEKLSEAVIENAPLWKGYLEADAVHKAAVQYDCPYVAVYDKYNVPVGWFMQHCVLGSLNHLFVRPEARGKGIGKFLIEQITEVALEKDGVSIIQIAKGNTLSMQMHKNVGYQTGGQFLACIILPEESQSTPSG